MNDRQAALDQALKQIEKQFGKGSIMKLGEHSDQNISTISSGSLALDIALGVGGYPRGRIIEVYGPESSVKQLLRFMQLRKYKHKAEQQHLSMLSMRWIRLMLKT